MEVMALIGSPWEIIEIKQWFARALIHLSNSYIYKLYLAMLSFA